MEDILTTILESVEKDENINNFLKQFQEGFGVELEHKETVNNDLITVARIVLDHLSEDSQYYTKLTAAKL